MKTLFFLFLWIAVVFSIQAQCNQEYKPFSSFKNNTEYKSDTIAYLMYNFDQRSDCYKGKTIGDILKDMELPIVNLNRTKRGDKVSGIYLSVKSTNGGELNELYDYYISISFRDSVNFSEMASLIKNYPEEKWVPQHYDYLKDIHVKSIYYNLNMQTLWRNKNNKKL